MWGPIAMGAAGGIATNEAQRAIDKNLHGDKPDEDMFSELRDRLNKVHKELSIISKHYKDASEPPIDLIVTLQVDPLRFKVDTKGRQYNMIFVPNGTTLISANIPGIGIFPFTPAAGWTSLDFASGTDLFLTSGTQQNIILRLTNTHLGGVLV